MVINELISRISTVRDENTEMIDLLMSVLIMRWKCCFTRDLHRWQKCYTAAGGSDKSVGQHSLQMLHKGPKMVHLDTQIISLGNRIIQLYPKRSNRVPKILCRFLSGSEGFPKDATLNGTVIYTINLVEFVMFISAFV